MCRKRKILFQDCCGQRVFRGLYRGSRVSSIRQSCVAAFGQVILRDSVDRATWLLIVEYEILSFFVCRVLMC